MGNKVPNSLLRSLYVCVCECDSVGAFVLVCLKLKRDVELGHKYYEEYSFCGISIFFMKGLTSLEFNDHVMDCVFGGGFP